MLLGQPLGRLLSWHPIYKSSRCNSFEDQTTVDFIYRCLIFKRVANASLPVTGSQGTMILVPAMAARRPIQHLIRRLIKRFHIVSKMWERCLRFSALSEIWQASRSHCQSPRWYEYFDNQSRGLTHWGRDTMAAISQTTLSNAFSWMKMLEFGLRFHWSCS